MKQFILAALAAATAYATGSACLYCRNEDLNSGLFVSYSYCQQQQQCLKDAWNYIRRDCPGGWVRGEKLSLNDCEPEEVTCPSFESSPSEYQKYTNTTWSMAAGSKCEVKVDATGGIARVIFSSTRYLGIEGYKIDEIINVDSSVENIVIYNAAESGPVTFAISFSGASSLVASAAAVAALAFLSF